MRNALLLSFLASLDLVTLCPAPAHADPVCRGVEVHLAPGSADLQMVVWLETADGKYVDTAYLTRLTGQFGLANRPGEGLLKTDFRWPYGRREMVLPVWAHRRDHHYPRVVMGGVCGNSPMTSCPGGGPCAGDCLDSTIAYHPRVSSYEPFYCSPSGPSKIDAMSCASKGSFSKGAYADPPAYSLYPPRADLRSFSDTDGKDAKNFAGVNDLVAVSQATPAGGAAIDPPITWYSPATPEGDYVLWVEVSRESDWNGVHTAKNAPNVADSVGAWDFEGHAFLGQPSVVYQVPFHFGGAGGRAAAVAYAGYGSMDGHGGELNPPDASITTDRPGSGAGRLLDQHDGAGAYKVMVLVGACDADGGVPACEAPDPVSAMQMTAPTATEVDVTFVPPAGGAAAARYSVRYSDGNTPITDDSFDAASSGVELPPPATPGTPLQARITGLQPSSSYSVAVRAISACNLGSHVVAQSIQTGAQKFTQLNGCFIATAAYGSELDASVTRLRELRDTRLLPSPAGRLLVAGYYAFSPSLAAAIAGREPLRALARQALSPLVSLVAPPR